MHCAAGSASGDTAAVVCNTTSPGFPTGTHTLQVQGTFAASAPCSGGPLTNGTTQVIVAAAPVVTVTPRPIAVPGCNGAASVFADFDYIISGAGATPALTVSVPAGCTFTGAIAAAVLCAACVLQFCVLVCFIQHLDGVNADVLVAAWPGPLLQCQRLAPLAQSA